MLVTYILDNIPSNELDTINETILIMNSDENAIMATITFMEAYAMAMYNAETPININDKIELLRKKLSKLREEPQKLEEKEEEPKEEEPKLVDDPPLWYKTFFKYLKPIDQQLFDYAVATLDKLPAQSLKKLDAALKSNNSVIYSIQIVITFLQKIPGFDASKTQNARVKLISQIQDEENKLEYEAALANEGLAGAVAEQLTQEAQTAREKAQAEGIAVATANLAQQLQGSKPSTLNNPNAGNEIGRLDEADIVKSVVADINKKYPRRIDVNKAPFDNFMLDVANIIEKLTPKITFQKQTIKLDDAFQNAIDKYSDGLEKYTALQKIFNMQTIDDSKPSINDNTPSDYARFIYYYVVYKLLSLLSKTNILKKLTTSVDNFQKLLDLEDPKFDKYLEILDNMITTGYTLRGTLKTNLARSNKYPTFERKYIRLTTADLINQARVNLT